MPLTLKNYRFRGETQELDAAARAAAPGQFVTLTEGRTHYELAGPPDAPAVMLIHGFSTPYFIWDPTFVELVAAGFRVLRHDLFGRGYSARPDVVYDQILFDRQLGELLDALGLTAPVHLVGLSMGSAIVVGFTARQPLRVSRLALLAPAGLRRRESLA